MMMMMIAGMELKGDTEVWSEEEEEDPRIRIIFLPTWREVIRMGNSSLTELLVSTTVQVDQNSNIQNVDNKQVLKTWGLRLVN